MKMFGEPVMAQIYETVVFPKGDSEFVFVVKSVDIAKIREELPLPKPPIARRPDGSTFELTNDSAYQKSVGIIGQQQFNLLCLRSLEATEGLEWETVKMNDPGTYGNWKQEFKDAGFNDGELSILVEYISSVNSLSDRRVKEATELFLARSKMAKLYAEPITPIAEATSTPSGEPAKG